MDDQALEAVDVSRMVRQQFGPSASHLAVRDGSVEFVLYDAFAVGASPDNYGNGRNWGFGIDLPNGMVLIELFGQPLTIKSTRDEVRATLALIDRYARLRLGAAYLAEFEATHPPLTQ